MDTVRTRLKILEGHLKKNKTNITLIGMPGVGKSTVGVILAKVLGYTFIDSDLLIQNREHKLLKEIIEAEGTEGFLAIEDQVNADIQATHAVIATGGSVVYGEQAMRHLGDISTIVYLKLPYERLCRRLGNLHNRGVALKPGQTLLDLYKERTVLYERYADIVIDESNQSAEDTLQAVLRALKG